MKVRELIELLKQCKKGNEIVLFDRRMNLNQFVNCEAPTAAGVQTDFEVNVETFKNFKGKEVQVVMIVYENSNYDKDGKFLRTEQ